MSDASAQGSEHLPLHHQRIRDRGVHKVVYWLTRAILQPFLLVYFRCSRLGREHIPDGPVLLAANHRSFLDPFLVGICLKRPIYFVAKRELFDKKLQGWFLNALGAFPIRRGEADAESMETALALLERGEAVVIFPEGTRHRSGSLGKPKRGVGRLALQSGAPVVPVAITGSERARRGWRIRPVKVGVRCGAPLRFPRVEDPSPSLAREVTERIWPCVGLQWEWLGGLPPLRTAAVIGAGSMGTSVAALLARAGLEVQLGCRTLAQSERLARTRENERYLPGYELDDGITVKTVPDIELAGVDLVVLAVPSSRLPACVGQIGAQIGSRTAVLVVSKGLVPPQAATPSAYVSERVRARAVAALGGPAHARDTLDAGASVVLASSDRDLRRQLADVLGEADLDVERTDDVVGTELAGCAKNAAALAAAAAGGHGPNMAGAAAGRVFGEVQRLAVSEGARNETFAGLAGVGDLVATTSAPGSRNRRAGELLGAGMPADQAQGAIDQTAESLATVPLLEQACGRERLDAPALEGLRQLLDGEVAPEDWLESVRTGTSRRARRAA